MAKNKRRRGGGGANDFQTAEAEGRIALWWRCIEAVEKIVIYSIVAFSVVASIYYGVYKTVEVSHGEETSITFILDWIADFKLNIALAWGAAAGCGGWAIAERKKRLREREERDNRIANLELQLDPNRSSSNLTTDGTDSRKAQDDG